jgi:hypothetical protein
MPSLVAFAPSAPTFGCLPSAASARSWERALLPRPRAVPTHRLSSTGVIYDIVYNDVHKCTPFVAQPPSFTLKVARLRPPHPALQRANVTHKWPENPSPAPKQGQPRTHVNKSDVVKCRDACWNLLGTTTAPARLHPNRGSWGARNNLCPSRASSLIPPAPSGGLKLPAASVILKLFPHATGITR